jgi:hypothetical protein
MKYFYLFFAVSLYASQLWAQDSDMNRHQDFHPCGTIGGKSEWLKEYQRNAAQNQGGLQRSLTTTYLPLTLHLVGRSDSGGAASLENVLASFCQLNADYVDANIQFYIEFPIRYHYNSDWYSHPNVVIGGQMMLQENIANTINVYFVSSPAGNCGYNLPYAGIAMNNGCLGGHTFAHEMGHALGMPHTFLGWEGGQSWDNSVPPNYAAPAPVRVTYNYTDFKDTIWTDTLIIDTAYVETVPRSGAQSNCSYAADGFCDTESDYLAYRWNCTATNPISAEQQIDPNGVAFYSNGANIMSYASDVCQSTFSNEQIAAMNAFIVANRQSYLGNQNPNNTPITATATHISPAAGATPPENNVRFTWASVPNATHYYLEVYREPYASNTIISQQLLTDTSYIFPTVLAPRPAVFPYAWRVRALNQGYTCTWFSQPTNFNTTIASGVENLNENADFAIQIAPNPVQRNAAIQLTVNMPTMEAGNMRIINALGQQIWQQNLIFEAGNAVYNIALEPLSAQSGLYFVQWQSQDGKKRWARQIIIE